MDNAIRSLYLERNQIPLKARIVVFKSVVLSHPSFSGVFLQTPTAKNINRINRQIKWGIKICSFREKFDDSIDLLIKDRVLSAELFISKVNLLKLQTNIRHWETSENFKCLLVAITLDRTKEHLNIKKKRTKEHQNKRT